MPKQVILDTNAWLVVGSGSINIDSELTRLFGTYTISVPHAVFHELNTINKAEAKVALSLIERKGYNLVGDKDTYADDQIVNLNPEVVFTHDKELKERLKQQGVTIIALRTKNHIQIV